MFLRRISARRSKTEDEFNESNDVVDTGRYTGVVDADELGNKQ